MSGRPEGERVRCVHKAGDTGAAGLSPAVRRAEKEPAPAPAAGAPHAGPVLSQIPVDAALFRGAAPRAALRRGEAALAAAGCPDPDFDARELLRLALGADPRLAQAPLTDPQAACFAALCQKRQERFPLQYLAGRWPFLDFALAVGPGVLIPRADSETVCLAAAECLRGICAPAVLDLCAGSGALALGVKRLAPGACVTALEKSPEALYYLAQNAAGALLGFKEGAAQGGSAQGAARPGPLPGGSGKQPPEGTAQEGTAGRAVRVVEGDVFCYQSSLAPASLDLILSNPPYLTGDEMRRLQPELCYEPAMALDGGPDGLRFYRHIAAAYRFALRPGAALVLEVGWQQAGPVAGLLRDSGWRGIETRRDLGGNLRVVLARAPAGND